MSELVPAQQELVEAAQQWADGLWPRVVPSHNQYTRPPRDPLEVRLVLTISTHADMWLDALAAEAKVSKQDVVRQIMRDYALNDFHAVGYPRA